MDSVNQNKADVVLLGDFNIDLSKSKGSHAAWASTTALFGLEQLVKTPTRTTSTSSTLIDHIYVTNDDKISNVHVPSLAVSDHNPVCCTVSMKLDKENNKRHKTIKYRSFKKFNNGDFLRDLSNTPFSDVYNHTSPDSALSCWMDLFLGVLNKHAPIREKRVKHSTLPPWLTVDIKQAMTFRDKLKKEKQFDEYKKQRNRVKYLVRASKKTVLPGND